MKNFFLYSLCGLILLTVAGCNTIKGLGKDFDAMGGLGHKRLRKGKRGSDKRRY